ncbi:hypothetical protein HED50_14210 [Ochrobactrum oryzae]|nr:hypothetical protein [Brucella oryzae]
MAIASGEYLAFRTNVAVGRRIVLELIGQESVRYPNTSKPLLGAAISFSPWPDKFNVSVMRGQNVRPTGIACIHHHLIR